MNYRNIKDFAVTRDFKELQHNDPVSEIIKNMMEVIEKQCKTILEEEGINCDGLNANNTEEFKKALSEQGFELICEPIITGEFDSIYELRYKEKVKSCFMVMIKDGSIKISKIQSF